MSTHTPADEPLYDAPAFTAYRRFWQRYVVFTGRAGRAEYWWPVLFNTVIAAVLGLLAVVLIAIGAALSQSGSAAQSIPAGLGAVLGILVALFGLAVVLPSISVAVRRLHDIDLSGWFVLLNLVPSVGGVIMLILHVLPANPGGRRFDRGAQPWLAPLPATAPVFDAWPAPRQQASPTTPVPFAPEPEPAAPTAPAARVDWTPLGEVEPVEPPRATPPGRRRIGYAAVARPDGTALLVTDGLGGAEGAAALGPGAEVFLALPRPLAEPAEGWPFGVVSAVAERVSASGMHLPAELEQYGTLSMSVPGAAVPEAWRAADGTTGVLIGLSSPGVPESVPTPGGEVRLVGITPLTPDELAEILAGGAPARDRVAARLVALPADRLTGRLPVSGSGGPAA